MDKNIKTGGHKERREGTSKIWIDEEEVILCVW